MDNFNALSKSAILTKLALDGYFIDLLTLTSFIKEWQIEAIYENEFGIEFFDNNSYLTILNKLKDKYNKAKPDGKKETPGQSEIKKEEPVEEIMPEVLKPAEDKISGEIEPIQNSSEDDNQQQPIVLDVLDIPKTQDAVESNKEKEPSVKFDSVEDSKTDIKAEYGAVSLEDLAIESKKEFESESKVINPSVIPAGDSIESVLPGSEESTQYDETIMPIAMKNLKPGPVSPTSTIVVDHSYVVSENKPANLSTETLQYKNNNEVLETSYEKSLDSFIEEENFSDDEIEKANNLINKAGKQTPRPMPESITETYIDIKPKEVSKSDKEAVAENPATGDEKGFNADKKPEQVETKGEELDLVQLAQSFAQNFTGKDAKDVPPADLEQIFTESYTEHFSELQDYVKDGPAEYKSLQEDLPSDIIPEVPKEATHSDSALVSHSKANLSADDVRNIIREEIARQTASIVPVPQNNENVKEILREIVKQTADVVPQNAFKLDISQGTLDMIAKTIAKKIAVKLNSYYKLNSSKQNAKLQLFRDRTIELKEKNQMLADENRKLKARLLESNSELNSYKRTIFGLYKFEGKKRR